MGYRWSPPGTCEWGRDDEGLFDKEGDGEGEEETEGERVREGEGEGEREGDPVQEVELLEPVGVDLSETLLRIELLFLPLSISLFSAGAIRPDSDFRDVDAELLVMMIL